MFDSLKYGITGRALKNNLLQMQFWNPRDFTQDKHHTVDDRPYGGGPGMVMMVKPLQDAIHAAKQALGDDTKVIYLSPQGRQLNHQGVEQIALNENLILLAGRYEGIDERLIDLEVDEEWSIGDYVVTGGELPAMVLIDAVTRLIPGALGHEDSAKQDSFTDGLLDYPHYTRPKEIAGVKVPSVLLEGNHEAIRQWRLKQAMERTTKRRPDLLNELK